MDKTEIIIFAVAMVFLAVRLYQKFKKKDKGKPVADNKTSSGSVFSSTSKDDDYEPYSKR
ncbi:MAG: hypothetical protein WCS03_11490 [Bacteroidota bacterium]